MHFSLISISEDVKSAIRSVESERDVVVKGYHIKYEINPSLLC